MGETVFIYIIFRLESAYHSKCIEFASLFIQNELMSFIVVTAAVMSRLEVSMKGFKMPPFDTIKSRSILRTAEKVGYSTSYMHASFIQS